MIIAPPITGKLKANTPATDFSLSDQKGHPVRPSDLLGRGPIVLYLYPMHDTEVVLPHEIDARIVEQVFDDVIDQSGLTVTLRDSLRAFPGCVHWHLKKGREAGTLELTLWPSERRAWFSVHRGRDAPWIGAELERLSKTLQQGLRRK